MAPRDPELRELKRLIRQSHLLDALLKRQWLGVVEQLQPADRARLRALLSSELQPAPPGPRADR